MSIAVNVTFDSNVWRPLVSPSVFSNDPDVSHFDVIRQAMIRKAVSGFLGEAVFTLEAIRRLDRKQFFGKYKADVKTITKITDENSVGMNFTVGPSQTSHAKNNPYLEKHFNDARPLGFKLLRTPRIAGIVNVDLKPEDYAGDERMPIEKRLERFGQIAREIESKGCGISHIKSLGHKHTKNGVWIDGIKAAPQADEKPIAEAIAEWADADALAAHYGYGNDYFCTRDTAKAAGVSSVMSASNRQWLHNDFGVIFVTPGDLARILANP